MTARGTADRGHVLDHEQVVAATDVRVTRRTRALSLPQLSQRIGLAPRACRR
jgi:hypothetical protein